MVVTIDTKKGINQLTKKGFIKTLDSINEYATNSDLYFKKVTETEFIVFNHYNKKGREENQGFDCWISKYKTANDIGKQKAIKTDPIKLTFDFHDDWELLSKYNLS